MAGKYVHETMPRRYRNCRHFLDREVEAFSSTLRTIIPIGNEAHRWCIAAAEISWPPITKPVTHYAYRFPPSEEQGANFEGLPNETAFAKFVQQCNPKSKVQLGMREKCILALYKDEFAEIKESLLKK